MTVQHRARPATPADADAITRIIYNEGIGADRPRECYDGIADFSVYWIRPFTPLDATE